MRPWESVPAPPLEGQGRRVGREERWEGAADRNARVGLAWGLTAAAARSEIAAGGPGAKVEGAAQSTNLADYRMKFKVAAAARTGQAAPNTRRHACWRRPAAPTPRHFLQDHASLMPQLDARIGQPVAKMRHFAPPCPARTNTAHPAPMGLGCVKTEKVKQRLEGSFSIWAISRRRCSVSQCPALFQRNSF
jgi:hypothetical protein